MAANTGAAKTPELGAAKLPGAGAATPPPSAGSATGGARPASDRIGNLPVFNPPAAPDAPAAEQVPTDPKAFQQYLNAHGAKPPLQVDGIVGPKTLAAANALGVPVPPNLQPAPTPSAPAATPAAAPAPTTAAATVPQPVSLSVDQIKAQYGYLGSLLDKPDIAALIQQRASDPSMSDEQFLAALYQTPTWRTTQTSVRNFIGLQAQDPAGLQAEIDQQKADIGNQAKTLGIPIADDRLAQLASDSIRLGWDTTQVRNAIGAEFQYKPGGQSGSVGAAEATAKALAQQYGVSNLLDDGTLASFDAQVANGTATTDDIKAKIVGLAQQQYAGLANQITVANPTQNVLAPYRQVAQSELGVNPDTIDFTQPMWMKAVNQIDDKGNHMPMSLSDWAQTLRSDPAYGWDRTPNGVAAGYQTATTLAKALGVMA